ncbi:hypothetical protein KIW84_023742 [Lathyrus oleraceus]|uniref:Reverse transcriptase zinc-binding domain-containing protein n=1 Tax=Pisum sativum TaxID=3888 RepID=A0A9D4YHK9_PEA|nr:hypothetical protein KIW84_023742 [Pisum sativum]
MVEVLRVRYDNFEHYILEGDLSDLKGPISTWWRDLVTSNISWHWEYLGISEEDNCKWLDNIKEVEAVLDKVTKGKEDGIVWTKEESGVVFAKFYFNAIDEASCLDPLDQTQEKAFGALWSTQVHIKIKVFGWKTLLNRLATRDLLLSRGIISFSHDLTCVFYFRVEENLQHIFFECGAVTKVWATTNCWIGYSFLEGEAIINSFLATCNILERKFKKNKKGIIWSAVLWSIWKLRNDILFEGQIFNINDLV